MIRVLVLLAAILFTSAWLLPNHHYPWVAYYNDLPAALALVLLAVSASIHHRWRAHQQTSAVSFAILCIATIPLAQYSSGLISFLGDAFMAVLYLGGLAIAHMVGLRIGAQNAREAITILASAILSAALVSVFLALHQWLQLDGLGIWLMDMPPGGRPYANLAQPNNLATLFILGVISLIYLRETCRLGGAVAALLGVLLFAGIAMTNSRTPLLVALVLAGWALANRHRLALKLSVVETVVALIVMASMWLSWPLLSAELGQHGANMAERAQSMERLVIWEQLLDAAFRSPWIGYGWNQVSMAQIAVITDYPHSLFVEHSHSIALDLLIWNGVVIGGAIIGVIAYWLQSRLRACRSRESWFGLAVVLAVGVHSMLEFPLEYAYFLLPVGLCAGIVDSEFPGRKFSAPQWLLPALTVAGFAALIMIHIEYQVIEEDHRRMRFESALIEPRKAPGTAPDVKILTQLAEFIRFARTEAAEDMSTEALQQMEKVAHRYPYPPALFRYALALGLNHQYDAAALELRRLKQLHPPARADEARQGWRALMERYPQLANVYVPWEVDGPVNGVRLQ